MLSNKDKFEAIFREHYQALANYAYTILRNEHDAEDVVQEVFIRIWQNSPEVIQTSQVKYYLFTAVKNGSISLLRKQAGKNFVAPEDVQLRDETIDLPLSPKEDLMELAMKALGQLPPQCQVIFKMSRFGKLTYQQIADELGLSVKTVENQVGKALKLMRDYAKQHNVVLSQLLWVITGIFLV